MLCLTASEILGVGLKQLTALVFTSAFPRTTEAGNNLTIIKGYKPCHTAIRPNSWQPINYDINGRNELALYKSALL